MASRLASRIVGRNGEPRGESSLSAVDLMVSAALGGMGTLISTLLGLRVAMECENVGGPGYVVEGRNVVGKEMSNATCLSAYVTVRPRQNCGGYTWRCKTKVQER